MPFKNNIVLQRLLPEFSIYSQIHLSKASGILQVIRLQLSSGIRAKTPSAIPPEIIIKFALVKSFECFH